MESIFNVIDIWLNIIPYVDYRTFYIIKRLNKAIHRDCYIKRKPLIEDLKQWIFNLKYDEEYKEHNNQQNINNIGWKKVKHITNKNKNGHIETLYIEKIKNLDYNEFNNFLACNLPYSYNNYKLKACLSLLIPGDIVDIYINKKHPYKFYYDGEKFSKMNFIIDCGRWFDRCTGKFTHYEPSHGYGIWKPDNKYVYVYPEHILYIVRDNLKHFLQNTRCLIHVTDIYDIEYKHMYNNPNNGHYKSINIGLHSSLPTPTQVKKCEKFKNILINNSITLNMEYCRIYDYQFIYAFY